MNSKEKKKYLMEQEPVGKALLKLGIPTMVGMMTSALYNLVDTFFVGKLGTAQIAAVSVAFPISIVFLAVGLLFGSGASSYLARLLGNKKNREADECFSTALVTAIGTGVVVICGMLLLLNPLLSMLGATDTIMPYAREYAIPFIIGLAFNVFNITVNNMISAEGAANYSMIAMLSGGLINIALDPILILGLHMGVFGAALIKEDGRNQLRIYLPYAVKEELGLSQCENQLIISVKNEVRNVPLPVDFQTMSVESAKLENGYLTISFQ